VKSSAYGFDDEARKSYSSNLVELSCSPLMVGFSKISDAPVVVHFASPCGCQLVSVAALSVGRLQKVDTQLGKTRKETSLAPVYRVYKVLIW
jgi:hypothetical protein